MQMGGKLKRAVQSLMVLECAWITSSTLWIILIQLVSVLLTRCVVGMIFLRISCFLFSYVSSCCLRMFSLSWCCCCLIILLDKRVWIVVWRIFVWKQQAWYVLLVLLLLVLLLVVGVWIMMILDLQLIHDVILCGFSILVFYEI